MSRVKPTHKRLGLEKANQYAVRQGPFGQMRFCIGQVWAKKGEPPAVIDLAEIERKHSKKMIQQLVEMIKPPKNFKASLEVQTRENRHWRYWCNATFGYDLAVEGDTVEEARALFQREYSNRLEGIELVWLPVEMYPYKEVAVEVRNPYLITSQKVRLDHNPQG